MMTPKVFISHASDDKERFVVPFATALRKKGVDVWLDMWEMLPGDSLVDKIFEEGLKDADSVIIVLSHKSLTKPWVREELNASVVARLNRNLKIIPVVIDDCQIPESLQTTVWQRIENPADYQTELDRIFYAIYGVTEKPTLGPPAAFVQQAAHRIEGLSLLDGLVLRLSAAFDLTNDAYVLRPEEIFTDLAALELTKEQILESIEVLDGDGYLEACHYIGGGPDSYGCHYQLTINGMERYCAAEIDDYEGLKTLCAGFIVNEDMSDNQSLAKSLNMPVRLVDHILGVFAADNLIGINEYDGGFTRIYPVSPKLRRLLA